MGAIKINGATSGSTTITAPATGGDESIELSTALASKLPYSYGTATPTTTDSGFLWFDSNSTPAATKFWDGSAFVPFGGKILQVVRSTDPSARSTSSSTFVDANISVTLTPKKSDSVIILIWSRNVTHNTTATYGRYQITDDSNNAISGAEGGFVGIGAAGGSDDIITQFGYATPATTSPVTYKGRFLAVSGLGSVTIQNNNQTGQLYAIEVGA